MIRKKLFIISLFFSIGSFAQTNVYHPFPDSNAHWTEGTYALQGGGPCVVYNDYTLFIAEDTIIGPKTYHKILASGYKYSNCPPPGYYYYNLYVGAIRQDTLLKTVYCHSWSGEQLLYDFKLNIGDTLPASYNNSFGNVVTGIDSVFVGSNYRKRFLLKSLSMSSPEDTSYAMIEGIGSTFGLFNQIVPPFESGSGLGCFEHKGNAYPKNANCTFAVGAEMEVYPKIEVKISPNPSTGIFTITSSEQFQFSVYDIFGWEVYKSTQQINQSSTLDLSSQPKGIYFVRVKSNERIVSKKIILQ